MKILYVLKQDADETAQTFMAVQRGSHDVSVVDIRHDKNYARLVKMIEESDRIICW